MHYLIIFGTRPEAIKLAPLVEEFKNDPTCKLTTLVTGQHREMLDQVLEIFDIVPDLDLNIMNNASSMEEVVSTILLKLTKLLTKIKPDIVIVHGDTATTLAAALAAYFNKIKIAHIEAGLRTFNIFSPWPEEGNRKMVGTITDFHFAPTSISRDNLLNEGVPSERIFVVGNTIIDALLQTVRRINGNEQLSQFLKMRHPAISLEKRVILVTGHRRENFGEGFNNICSALFQLAQQNSDVEIIYPVHLNPNVRGIVLNKLSGVSNVHLIEPLDYMLFVELMLNSYLILTDSGGIQEEAPSLDKPVLLMRDTTERPEGVACGTVKMVGTNTENIILEVNRLLRNKADYAAIANCENPYGDGHPAKRIKAILVECLEGK